MAYVAGRISLGKLLANFAIVYVANFIGAAGLAAVVALSGHAQLGDGAIGRTAVAIASAKVALPFAEAFFRGVLCNVLVCLAVWLAMAGRTVTDKILAIVFPICRVRRRRLRAQCGEHVFHPARHLPDADIGVSRHAAQSRPRHPRQSRRRRGHGRPCLSHHLPPREYLFRSITNPRKTMKTKPSKTNPPAVLCGTDFTTNSAQAADAACALAQLLHAPLELVHVSEIPAHPPLERELAAEAARLRGQGAEVRASILAGIPDEEIVKRAKPKSCRMVVVSSLGRRGPGRWLLGSVSERTAERASVPTVVVRNAAPFREWARGERPLKVFVAFNFTATAEAALQWVKTLLEMGPCEVVVGYVDFPLEERARLGGTGPVPLVGNLPEVQTVLERDLQVRVSELLGTDKFRVRVDANWGQPNAPLAAMAMQLGADLIVVGSHQYHGFERFWNGSVSSGILRDAAMSVAVVPMKTSRTESCAHRPAAAAGDDGHGLLRPRQPRDPARLFAVARWWHAASRPCDPPP